MKVMTLHAQGETMKGIARELAIDHRTVSKFISRGAFPARAPRARGATPLAPCCPLIDVVSPCDDCQIGLALLALPGNT
jgi:hypothetical protein